ncbi:MAG: hypothetical protein ACP5MX_02565 [Candidatus Micrarchaeia archaeon]
MLYLYIALLAVALIGAVAGIAPLKGITRYYKEQSAKLNIALTLSIAISMLVLYYLHSFSSYYYIVALASADFAIASLMLAFAYGRKPCAFTGYFSILVVAAFVLLALHSFIYSTWLFGIGTILGLLVRDERRKHKKARTDSRLEIRRDVFQIILGAIVIGIACLLGYQAGATIIFLLLLTGYTLNNLIYNSRRTKKLFVLLSRFERKSDTYGYGAAYIAAGTSLIIGLSGTLDFMVFALAVLFFSDAVATIAGKIIGGQKMPYVRNKTVAGFAAFLAVSAISYYAIYHSLLGSILIGTAVALVESYSFKIDDNATISTVLVLIRNLIAILY